MFTADVLSRLHVLSAKSKLWATLAVKQFRFLRRKIVEKRKGWRKTHT